MRTIFLMCAAVILSTAGCEEASAPSTSTVTVTARDHQLTMMNSTNADVHYIVFESSLEPLIDWIAICTENNRIGPHSVKVLSYTDSTYLPSNTVRIYWWHKGRQGPEGVYIADSLRGLIVPLQ